MGSQHGCENFMASFSRCILLVVVVAVVASDNVTEFYVSKHYRLHAGKQKYAFFT